MASSPESLPPIHCMAADEAGEWVDMQAHLVAYEYGTGSVWGYVVASSRQEIIQKMPEVDIHEDPPAWMTADHIDVLRERHIELENGEGLDELVHRTHAVAA